MHDLSIDESLVRDECRERRAGRPHPREPRGPVLAMTGEQLAPVAGERRDDAVAVVFDLVQPLVTTRHRGYQGRKLRHDPWRQRSPTRSGNAAGLDLVPAFLTEARDLAPRLPPPGRDR